MGQFVKPRLQCCDAGVLSGDTCILLGDVGVRQSQPGGQRRNQRVLFGVAQLGGNRKPGYPLFTIDSAVTASRVFLSLVVKLPGSR